MKIQIEINESFAQDLLLDKDFQSELSFVYEGSKIKELWVENKIIDNEEIMFKTQVLEMVKRNYCRINGCDSQFLTISYDSNVPKEVLFTGPKYRLGHLVKIKIVKNE